ncbi:MAG TPA: ferrochelatase [Bryobacteraceae bacterium]|nr:ferrochelatase [Bryobacteraceae bacterium]
MRSGKLGVVLFQLGGPDSLEAVEPFLYNLFSDPDIIDFPFSRLAREPLARLMASRRARHAAEHYRALGGASPLLENTRRQAEALEAELRRDLEARVVVAMRYWRPFTSEAITELARFAPERLVLLPLYPQYSNTTTGSSLNEWSRRFHPDGWRPEVRVIRDFHDDPGFIRAVAAHVEAALAGFPDRAAVEVVFSAHSIPMEAVERGDPYPRQVERTVELVWRQGGWPNRYELCYQSKVGPSRWLRPMLKETLEKLAARGAQHVLVVPISFVSDHVETLYEIAIEHREIAHRLGIRDFRMMPGLNDSPHFIGALAQLVRRAL